tara:strand:+ start:47 stop:205 length:159 start_codon:yes stop_codon:yes gene_type:complete
MENKEHEDISEELQMTIQSQEQMLKPYLDLIELLEARNKKLVDYNNSLIAML